MRLTAHEDGWVYGIFCAERHDPNAPAGDLSSATATAAIARTKDFKNWERLPDLKTKSQQRNVVLHPEFADGKYALYTQGKAKEGGEKRQWNWNKTGETERGKGEEGTAKKKIVE